MKTRPFTLIALCWALAPSLQAAEKIAIQEELRPDDAAVVSLEFKAQGDLLTSQGDKKQTAQKFSAKGRIVFEEKILPVEGTIGAPSRKSLRYYTASAIESAVEDKRTTLELREPARLLVNEVRSGRPFVFSPSGPLTVEEYELVDSDASLDSLVLGGLLPAIEVAVGDSWKPADSAVAAIFNLAKLTKNEVGAKLESFDAATAKISLTGHVAGIASGASCVRTIAGQLVFDRAHSKITQLDLSHSEERSAGPLGLALQAKATYNFRRNLDAAISHLNEKELAKLPLDANPATEQLVYVQPDGRFRFHFQRGWFVVDSNPQAALLRLIEDGVFVSECHVLAAPTVAAGTHMKPDDFRSQVQQALGSQFQKFIQEGEIPAPKGYWMYRLAAAGTLGQNPVVWYYHVAAGPQGQQLVFIFKVGADQIDEFGAKDLALVGTIEYETPRTVSKQKQP